MSPRRYAPGRGVNKKIGGTACGGTEASCLRWERPRMAGIRRCHRGFQTRLQEKRGQHWNGDHKTAYRPIAVSSLIPSRAAAGNVVAASACVGLKGSEEIRCALRV